MESTAVLEEMGIGVWDGNHLSKLGGEFACTSVAQGEWGKGKGKRRITFWLSIQQQGETGSNRD